MSKQQLLPEGGERHQFRQNSYSGMLPLSSYPQAVKSVSLGHMLLAWCQEVEGLTEAP